MNKKRQVYKQRMSALAKDIHNKYTNKRFVQQRLADDGSVQIDVVLPQDMPLFDEMAPARYGLVNPEILRCIDEQVYYIPAENDITINFVGRQLSPAQQKQLSQAVHDHYNLQVYDKLDDIRRNRALGIFLLVFGALALALYFVMTLAIKQEVFLEIMSIVGTFAVWEAVDCWLIQGHERKVDLNNALQMALAKVKFDAPAQQSPQK